MRTLVHSFVLFSVFSLFGTSQLPPVPASSRLDSESSVSSSVFNDLTSQDTFGFDFHFVGTSSNNVEASIGAAGSEDAVRVGWDCGAYFVERGKASQRWIYPVKNRAEDRSLSYVCRLSSSRLQSFVLETPEGALTPDGILQRKRHVLRWQVSANGAPQGTQCEFYLGDIRAASRMESARDGTHDEYLLGAALGVPHLPFSATAPYEIYSGVSNCVRIVCRSNETATVETECITYKGTTDFSFGWCLYRSDAAVSPSLDFYVDGVKVKSEVGVRVRPDVTGHQEHLLEWVFSVNQAAGHKEQYHNYVYDLSFSDRTVGTNYYPGVGEAFGCPDLLFTGGWVARTNDPPYSRTYAESPGTRPGASARMSTSARFAGTVSFSESTGYMGGDRNVTRYSRFYLDGDLIASNWNDGFEHDVSTIVPTGQLYGVTHTFTETTVPTGGEWSKTYGTDTPHRLLWRAFSTNGTSSDMETCFASFGVSGSLYPATVQNPNYTLSAVFSHQGFLFNADGGTKPSAWSVSSGKVRAALGDFYKTCELTTDLYGTGTVSFWFSVCNQSMAFYADGILIKEKSVYSRGETVTLNLTSPTAAVAWPYSRDWNRIRVTRRGPGTEPVFSDYTVRQQGGIIQIK